MRLFVALEIPAAVRENLAALVGELRVVSSRSRDTRPRWVRPENLHLTLKFIGETDPRKVEGIRAALSKVRTDTPVELQFRGLGFFPHPKHPHIFWAGVKASANLSPLAADVDRVLEAQGFAREERPFTPHLTLARFKPPGLSDELANAIEQNAGREFGNTHASEFRLVESVLQSTGAVYKTIETFSFLPEP